MVLLKVSCFKFIQINQILPLLSRDRIARVQRELMEQPWWGVSGEGVSRDRIARVQRELMEHPW